MHKNFEEAEGGLPLDEAEKLRVKAAQCRRLAVGIADYQTANALKALADEYERDAGATTARQTSTV
ncbi:MAG: hypothetical protein KF730_09505 [Sphingomonas sp.]|uniref:hypothetical protein n=1 Tax=Sphingomonas sp. TaxID=28214 RepID=UPI0025E7A6B8|nr:hypothetical protein [Sphingomonas sp.]MBX3564798.1 hypothetical protein [Sphingomonas sp.]